MGQQHRVRTKRKRRKSYLERKKAASRTTRREPRAVKPKKSATSAS